MKKIFAPLAFILSIVLVALVVGIFVAPELTANVVTSVIVTLVRFLGYLLTNLLEVLQAEVPAS